MQPMCCPEWQWALQQFRNCCKAHCQTNQYSEVFAETMTQNASERIARETPLQPFCQVTNSKPGFKLPEAGRHLLLRQIDHHICRTSLHEGELPSQTM